MTKKDDKKKAVAPAASKKVATTPEARQIVFGEEAKLDKRFRVSLPPLTEVQCNSYRDFLQADLRPDERKNIGLQQLFTKAFPIESSDKKYAMSFLQYSFGAPKYTIEECKRRSKTYEVPLKIKLRIGKVDSPDTVSEDDVTIGMIPMMTDNGTFIVNGVERVIVSQLHRSPGIYFKDFENFTIIPSRGNWLDALVDRDGQIYFRVDRKAPSRYRAHFLTFLQAIGGYNPEELMNLFYDVSENTISETNIRNLDGMMLAQGVTLDPKAVEEGVEPELKKCQVLNIMDLQRILASGIKKIRTYRTEPGSPIVAKLGNIGLGLLREVGLKAAAFASEKGLPLQQVKDLTKVLDKMIASKENAADAGQYREVRSEINYYVNFLKDALDKTRSKKRKNAQEKSEPVAVGTFTFNEFRGAWMEIAENKKERFFERMLERFDAIVSSIGSWDGQSMAEVAKLSKTAEGGNMLLNYKKAANEELCRCLCPGNIGAAGSEENYLRRLFFDPKTYDLSEVGRFKLDGRLGLSDAALCTGEDQILDQVEIIDAVAYFLALRDKENKLFRDKNGNFTHSRFVREEDARRQAEGKPSLLGALPVPVKIDDIDHLSNRRIRPVGEMVANEVRIALAKMDKYVKERMSTLKNAQTQAQEAPQPDKLINPRNFTSRMREFFGRSQLSQFMDQLNPLAELTHKRRLSALGPGGLNRDRAGLKVRDVHNSHYGRVCPIETPEGANIGLISSMSTYARTDKYGFIQTPYLKVVKGEVQTPDLDENGNAVPVYLSADEEERYTIAQANARRENGGKDLKDGHPDRKGNVERKIKARQAGDFKEVLADDVQFIDVSPKQIVSVAAGLIPFLEHDDANRALMGSNMQRQAVPLLTTQAPMVRTGLEKSVALESGAVLTAECDGEVLESDAVHVVIGHYGKDGEAVPDQTVQLRKFERSNAGTTINYHPAVKPGAQVKKGDVIANGPACADGVLSLGRNILCAYMPWEGYNFEDAIVISERALKEDFYTSVHIESFSCEAVDTKMGKEETTRDIPNVSSEALDRLDADGIIIPGTEVKPGDILVGKITPKSETEKSPEDHLLKVIFGEKAEDVRDASLRVPEGTYGTVMHVDTFCQKKSKDAQEKMADKNRLKAVQEEYAKEDARVEDEYNANLRKLFERPLQGDIVEETTGEVRAEAGKPIPADMGRMLKIHKYLKNLIVYDPEFEKEFNRLNFEYDQEKDRIKVAKARKEEEIRKGDDLEPHQLKVVVVYIAIKQRLQVGDKMAGRHGNKGIVAKILAEEDMPFLEDGTPVDIVLNPLGVPSRMNVGQIMEAHLGWACKMLGVTATTPVFDGATEQDVCNLLKESQEQAARNSKDRAEHPERCATSIDPELGKVTLYDGRTGDAMYQKVTVGYTYFMKLGHLVANKIHARATGPYSLVTQQPLGGKAQSGGQRFGEMEVWALEAYGAAYTLQEMLTVKSDDTEGRKKTYDSITKGDCSLEAATPESFNVLKHELKAACLDIRTESNK